MKVEEIFDFDATKVKVDTANFLTLLKKEFSKYNFDEDYLKQGGVQVLECYEIKFHTCKLENFTESRRLLEVSRPNSKGFQLGNKSFSEFDPWKYTFVYKNQFENSEAEQIIEESHHAIGCSTCNQNGAIKCSSCRGVGDVKCLSCSGRGEIKCNRCSGVGEVKCWKCSGKGVREVGFGDDKRIETCSSCNGLGKTQCSECANGYITCGRCFGDGRVGCNVCHSSGEVICFNCEGNRTMDHYFVVKANYINLIQTLFVTSPYSGFDSNKAVNSKFDIENKLIEFKENKFRDGYFQSLSTHPLYKQICAFFDFENSSKTKLISSRISVFENRYFEVVFSFFDEQYTIFFDSNCQNSFYKGNKPSDQYEIDLLKNSLGFLVNNDLEKAKKSFTVLSKYDYLDLQENRILSLIDDTVKIYDANTHLEKNKYSAVERKLESVSPEKKNDADYIKISKRLRSAIMKFSVGIAIAFSTVLMFALYYLTDFAFFEKNLAIGLVLIALVLLVSWKKSFKFSLAISLAVSLTHIVSTGIWYRARYPSELEIEMSCDCTDPEVWVFKSGSNVPFESLPIRLQNLRRKCHDIFERGEFKFDLDHMNSRERDAYERAKWVCENFSDKQPYEEINKNIFVGDDSDYSPMTESERLNVVRTWVNNKIDQAEILYIKQVNSDQKNHRYSYEVPVTFIALNGKNILYWKFIVHIFKGELESVNQEKMSQGQFEELKRKNL